MIRSPDLGAEPQWPDMEKQLKLLTIRLIPVGLDATSAVRVIRRVPRGPRVKPSSHTIVSAQKNTRAGPAARAWQPASVASPARATNAEASVDVTDSTPTVP